jgi:hypothetical protein
MKYFKKSHILPKFYCCSTNNVEGNVQDSTEKYFIPFYIQYYELNHF